MPPPAYSTFSCRTEIEDWPNAIAPAVFSLISRMPFEFLNSSHTAASTMPPNTSLAPDCPPWPALTISAAATLSGNGRSASTTRVRRSTITNSTPITPPMSMIAVLSQYRSVSQAPVITNAGIVKIAPAIRDSPTEAVVRAMFSSSIVPLKGLRTAMATTAAGKAAATVSPAFMPTYALAAPSTMAMMTPNTMALKVSSAMFVSAGT